jgi:hypothetical protein
MKTAPTDTIEVHLGLPPLPLQIEVEARAGIAVNNVNQNLKAMKMHTCLRA